MIECEVVKLARAAARSVGRRTGVCEFELWGRAWQGAAKSSGRGQHEAQVWAAAVNGAIDECRFLRRLKAATNADGSVAAALSGPSPPSDPDGDFRAYLPPGLSEAEAEVLILRFVYGMRRAEVAALGGVEDHVVKYRNKRAMAAVRRKLKAEVMDAVFG